MDISVREPPNPMRQIPPPTPPHEEGGTVTASALPGLLGGLTYGLKLHLKLSMAITIILMNRSPK